MTSILSLPKLGPGTSFAITRNSDWLDGLYFSQPNSPSSPLDLRGIAFHGQLRSRVGVTASVLDLSTADSTLINGGIAGTLNIRVPQLMMSRLVAGSYVLDFIAMADGIVVNLFPEGPAKVVLTDGVTTVP